MVCKTCDASLETAVNFCPNCGVPISVPKGESTKEHLNLVISFYIVMLGFLIINYFLYKDESSLLQDIATESVFALIIIGFTFFDFKNIIKLYRFPKINFLHFLGYLLVPFASAFLVYYAVEFINDQLSDETYNYYLGYIDYPNPMFWAVLFVAIFPPVFEELGFRGFLYNQLLKITSTKVTIILTAFIFALVHFSVISLLWIFPFGLLLGYLRHKYNTLWIGMIIHFIHNFIVLYLDYYYFDSTLLEF
ncbi:CPBP family intramembrane glutamic endopeptidase [Aquimarina sp. 2201CG14-23]|uniref:CPBP family intramembrane glutamic endopeptidase n=1 Tax=Aquimarina mycalae TaxID=3040073 RepID=UPI0024782754|nr:type II CAAX endopeptidase family protein [Aquimarina sp. 2201CG14-23]MDH7448371.1 type II CAAX endopeptidase family protein [Aquimarina sp. 2201CG14-23]